MRFRHALLVLLLLLAPLAARADGRDVFTVANVPVDATAANANAARDAARAEGERRAYAILIDRITLAADAPRAPQATTTLLQGLIAGFEVANERTSGVRYLANYTYHFRADAVRRMLRQAQIPYCETPSKPVLVLPVFAGGGAPVLWEDPNPWRDAWTQNLPRAGLVPLVLANGDLEDLQAIDAAAALDLDPAKLQAVSERYKGADVLVTEATLAADVAPHTLTVKSTRVSPGSALPPQSFTKTFVAAPDESDADLLAAAVGGTDDQLEEAWKEANVLDMSRSAVLMATVPADSLDAFVAVRDRLRQVPAIQRADLLSLDRGNAHFALHYYGSPEQLRTALAQRDLTLSGQDPDWVIEPAAPASAGPPAAPQPAAPPPAASSDAPPPAAPQPQ